MNKTLVITGASRGIGAKTAEMFIGNGWHCVNLSRSACKVDGVDNIQVDLASEDWGIVVEEHLSQQLTNTDHVCLVHNAAQFELDSVVDVSEAQFARVMRLNVQVPLLLNQMVLPFCNKQSSIVYVGSTLASKAIAGAASYVVSKHALVGLMRATCQDLINYPIHTCCICPGFTETEMLLERAGGDPSVMQSLRSAVGANRLIHPEEIARCILFAADNPVINGSVIHANLGQIER